MTQFKTLEHLLDYLADDFNTKANNASTIDERFKFQSMEDLVEFILISKITIEEDLC